MIYIGSDHGGYDFKKQIYDFLKLKGFEVEDSGPKELLLSDDYPDYALEVAKGVLKDPYNLGVLICRNGVGMCIAANKIKGIRAGISWNAPHAISSKRDDNTNVLCIPADYAKIDTITDMIYNWIITPFSDDERHVRRLKKVEILEK